MTHFAKGDHLIIKWGKQQGKKATVIESQPADVYKLKVEDGWVVFYSGKGLQRDKEGAE
jgi:ribosomal protein L24